MEWRWKTNDDQSRITINIDTEIIYFKQTQISKRYEEVNEESRCKIGFLGRFHANGIFKFLFQQQEFDDDPSCNLDEEYNDENIVI